MFKLSDKKLATPSHHLKRAEDIARRFQVKDKVARLRRQLVRARQQQKSTRRRLEGLLVDMAESIEHEQ